ncbi:hypothetical protein BSKO_08168 [Bryopsis sp. KO-2023]|nr:hypothetical protein BSKO_08168 [Bryopsis sp. KO-2023]
MAAQQSHQEKRLHDWAESNKSLEEKGEEGTQSRKRRNPYEKNGGVHKRGKGAQEFAFGHKLRYQQNLVKEAEKSKKKLEKWLLPGGAGYIEAGEDEATHRYSQKEIVDEVEIGAGKKVFDMDLGQLGPYNVDFTRNGRYMVIGGRKGHLAEFDWQSKKLLNEIHVRETVRDVKFLHNHLFWAAAQKNHVYIYNQDGEELHRLSDQTKPYCLEYLPYHFLLCSIGERGVVCWQDTSTGRMVARTNTKKGSCRVMRHNPWNAVLCCGHDLGSVTMWTPNHKDPVVRMLCHRAPIRSLAIDGSGRYMVTAGGDRRIKVWDVRKYEELHSYSTTGSTDSLDVSQTGIIAVAAGNRIEVWKDALSEKQAEPYLRHKVLYGDVERIRFCPYEDVLGIGHAKGISTVLVPGAGEPNFDSLVANPFQTRQGRREMEVKQLLDKIQPEMIMLDPTAVAKVVPKAPKVTPTEAKESEDELSEIFSSEDEDGDPKNSKNEEEATDEQEPRRKTRMKGKNKPSRVQARKEGALLRENAKKKKEKHEEHKQRVAEDGGVEEGDGIPEGVPFALRRFYK